MKISELRKKSKEDLEKLVQEKQGALKTFRFGISGSKIKNVKEGRNLRKDIAQVKTVLCEKD